MSIAIKTLNAIIIVFSIVMTQIDANVIMATILMLNSVVNN